MEKAVKPPYIIAEIGLNHEGSPNCAMEMIREAAAAGASAAKFQAVFPDRLVSRNSPTYFHQEGDAAKSQHEFFWRVGEPFGPREFEQLAQECRRVGIDFLCTVFDVESVHWIAPLVPAFKVASADITNIPLLEAIASYKKPVYLSTGAATREEVRTARNVLGLNARITLLHCVLSYPTPLDEANLEVIRTLKDWPGPVGYSDHTLFNLDVLTTAWLLGATVIEKHFTLDKTLPGNDHYHSMDPTDLRLLVAKFKELQAMIGDGEKRVLPIEEAARLNARQSWHAARDLPAAHVLTESDIVLKRPGTGLPPQCRLVGRPLVLAVRADDPITADTMGSVLVPA